MLAKPFRLRANRDFQAVYRQGQSVSGPGLALYLRKRTGEEAQKPPHCRVGFVVGKKVGKAAARNRLRRRLREAVRLLLPKIDAGPYDLVFVGRNSLLRAPWPDLLETVETLLKKAGVIAQCHKDGEDAEFVGASRRDETSAF